MKRTNSVGKVLLVALLVSAIAAGIFELCLHYCGVKDTIVGLGIIAVLSMIMIVASVSKKKVPTRNKWSENNRERMWHQKHLSDEAFRHKYCK